MPKRSRRPKRNKSEQRFDQNVLIILCEGPTEENYIRYLRKVFDKDIKLEIFTKSKLSPRIKDDISSYAKSNSISEEEIILLYDLENSKEEYNKFINAHCLIHENTFLTQPCIETHFLMHHEGSAISNNKYMSQDQVESKLKKVLPDYKKGSFSWEKYGVGRQEIILAKDYSTKNFKDFNDKSFSMVGLLIGKFFI